MDGAIKNMSPFADTNGVSQDNLLVAFMYLRQRGEP